MYVCIIHIAYIIYTSSITIHSVCSMFILFLIAFQWRHDGASVSASATRLCILYYHLITLQ